MSDKEQRGKSKLHEMVIRGTEYKEDIEVELYGEEVPVVIQPLVDNEYLPLAAFLASHLGLEGEDADEAVSESIDKLDEAREDVDENIDLEKLDEEFVTVMQKAAKDGIVGSYRDGEFVEHTEDEIDFIIDNIMGGASVELGGRVLEISGDVRDAEKFRGGRGSVADSRDS